MTRRAPRRAFDDDRVRHRLLDGFLLRLAGAADPDAFVLRGGMLVRHWFPRAGRLARDIDLVCRLPYDSADLRVRLAAILADARVTDGVSFDERFRLDPLWPEAAEPGLRLFVAGEADGRAGEMSVDLTFGLDVWPAAERRTLALERGAAPVWVCRPEMLVGRKLRVTADLRGQWRAKDLADVWRILRFGDLSGAPVGEAIERAGVDLGAVPTLLDEGSWASDRAAARWSRYRSTGGRGLPDEISVVTNDVRAALRAVVGAGWTGC